MRRHFGYALVHRRAIVAAAPVDEPGRWVYCIYRTLKQAQAAQREAPHCAIHRVHIWHSEPLEK